MSSLVTVTVAETTSSAEPPITTTIATTIAITTISSTSKPSESTAIISNIPTATDTDSIAIPTITSTLPTSTTSSLPSTSAGDSIGATIVLIIIAICVVLAALGIYLFRRLGVRVSFALTKSSSAFRKRLLGETKLVNEDNSSNGRVPKFEDLTSVLPSRNIVFVDPYANQRNDRQSWTTTDAYHYNNQEASDASEFQSNTHYRDSFDGDYRVNSNQQQYDDHPHQDGNN